MRTDAAARARGAFYTPEALADRVVGLALGPLAGAPRILDPACGDGVLLAAAARRLLGRGIEPAAVAASLHGIDRDAGALGAARARLEGVLGGVAAAVRLVVADALATDAAERLGAPFDAIVANPPYLSVKRPHLSAEERAALRSRFRLARGQFDAHGLFLERCLPLLAPRGRWAFVLPRPVLGNGHLADVRRLALEEGALDASIDAGAPFAAAVEAVVLAGGRGRAAGTIRCEGPAGEALPGLPVSGIRALPSAVLPVGCGAAELDLHRRLIATGTPLGDLFTVGRGIEAGKRTVGIVPAGSAGAIAVRAGAEVSAHRIAAPARALLPGWIPAAKRKDAALYRGPKLLVRRVASVPIAAVDPTDTPALNTLYLLHARAGGLDRPFAAAAALNTPALAIAHRVATAAGDRLFPYLRAADLAALPLPPPGSAREVRLAAIGRALAARPDPTLAAEADRLVRDA